eukprot:scaffold1103_cov91-Isochrysis_galbana.AAC.2
MSAHTRAPAADSVLPAALLRAAAARRTARLRVAAKGAAASRRGASVGEAGEPRRLTQLRSRESWGAGRRGGAAGGLEVAVHNSGAGRNATRLMARTLRHVWAARHDPTVAPPQKTAALPPLLPPPPSLPLRLSTPAPLPQLPSLPSSSFPPFLPIHARPSAAPQVDKAEHSQQRRAKDAASVRRMAEQMDLPMSEDEVADEEDRHTNGRQQAREGAQVARDKAQLQAMLDKLGWADRWGGDQPPTGEEV